MRITSILFLLLVTLTIHARTVFIETEHHVFEIDNISLTINKYNKSLGKGSRHQYSIVQTEEVSKGFQMTCTRNNEYFLFELYSRGNKTFISYYRNEQDIKSRPQLLKTARGFINFDRAKIDILDGAKSYYEQSGADSQGLGTFLQQVGHRVDEISNGNVTEISSARAFVGNTTIPDYSNFKQKVKGNIFSGKSSVWDEDALGNLASGYVLDRLSIYNPYEENNNTQKRWKLVIDTEVLEMD